MRVTFRQVFKGLRFFTHPILLSSLFLILPIIPGRIDSLYFNFILQGLPDLKFYALAAVAGIVVLIYSLVKHKLIWHEKMVETYIGSWFNMGGIILILLSLASFYSLDSTPYFQDSTSSFFSLFTFIYFFLTCHLFNGFNIAFAVVNAMAKFQDKSEFYDDDDYYGNLDDNFGLW